MPKSENSRTILWIAYFSYKIQLLQSIKIVELTFHWKGSKKDNVYQGKQVKQT